jgi:hypothetical protein
MINALGDVAILEYYLENLVIHMQKIKEILYSLFRLGYAGGMVIHRGKVISQATFLSHIIWRYTEIITRSQMREDIVPWTYLKH